LNTATVRDFFKARFSKGTWQWKILLQARGVLEMCQRIRCRLLLQTLRFRKMDDLTTFEAKWFSQNGEDGILQALFRKIGAARRFAVEFGVENGSECNTRYLREKQGWACLLMDPNTQNPDYIQREFITAENINHLFRKYKVPEDLDLLSIDIDGNDYWIWKAIEACYRPRVVVIEYNAKILPTESKSIAYDPSFRWDGTNYFGASLLALARLAKSKGYALAGCESRGTNAFFVREDLYARHFKPHSFGELYQPPTYGYKKEGYGHPPSSKTFVDV
jgi:hypothetical protein